MILHSFSDPEITRCEGCLSYTNVFVYGCGVICLIRLFCSYFALLLLFLYNIIHILKFLLWKCCIHGVAFHFTFACRFMFVNPIVMFSKFLFLRYSFSELVQRNDNRWTYTQVQKYENISIHKWRGWNMSIVTNKNDL